MYINRLKFCLAFLWMFYAFSVHGANIDYVSLHQTPTTLSDSKGIQSSYFGFKNQYSPSGVPGCQLGFKDVSSFCTNPTGFQFLIPNLVDSKYRVFVPAGVTRFSLNGYLPKGQQYAVAMRFNTPPEYGSPLTESEYRRYNAQDTTKVNQDLASGSEVVVVADGGGSIFLLDKFGTLGVPTTVGRWLYIKRLTGDTFLLGAVPVAAGSTLLGGSLGATDTTPQGWSSYLANLSGTAYLDTGTYLSAYNGLTNENKWESNGDPTEGDASATVSIDFTISPASLTQGSAGTAKISGSNVNLGACTIKSGNDLGYVTLSNGNVTLNPNAPAIASSLGVVVNIQCGSVSKPLTVLPKPSPALNQLSSITLSQYSVLSNDLTTVVTVTPNNGATITNCTASTSAASTSASAYVTFSGSTFKLTEKAKTTITDTKRELIVTCDSVPAIKVFTIDVPPPPLTITDKVESDDSLTLNLKFNPDDVSSSSQDTVRLWTVLYVPENREFGIKTDQYYFLLGTSKLVVLDITATLVHLDDVMLKKIEPLQTYPQDVAIKTGFSTRDFVAYKAQMNFFYQIGNNPIKYLGKVYPH